MAHFKNAPSACFRRYILATTTWLEQDEKRPFKWSGLQAQLELQRCLLNSKWDNGERKSTSDRPDPNPRTGRNEI